LARGAAEQGCPGACPPAVWGPEMPRLILVIKDSNVPGAVLLPGKFTVKKHHTNILCLAQTFSPLDSVEQGLRDTLYTRYLFRRAPPGLEAFQESTPRTSVPQAVRAPPHQAPRRWEQARLGLWPRALGPPEAQGAGPIPPQRHAGPEGPRGLEGRRATPPWQTEAAQDPGPGATRGDAARERVRKCAPCRLRALAARGGAARVPGWGRPFAPAPPPGPRDASADSRAVTAPGPGSYLRGRARASAPRPPRVSVPGLRRPTRQGGCLRDGDPPTSPRTSPPSIEALGRLDVAGTLRSDWGLVTHTRSFVGSQYTSTVGGPQFL
jgi:hypothetical protein